jgi:integrase
VPNARLTDLGLRNYPLPPSGQIDLWDDAFPGGCFGCRISQGGTKTFVVKKNNRRVSIGRFPVLSLAEARAEAKRILAEATLGKNRPGAVSYEHAKKLFLEDSAKRNKPGTHAEYERLLNRLKFSGQLAQFTDQEFERKLNRFGSPSERRHVLVAAKVFFSWCIKRRYLTDSPASGIEAPKSPSRSRVLTDEELQCIWQTCEQSGDYAKYGTPEKRGQQLRHAIPRLPAGFATIVQLLILTGQRRGEIAALQTSWIHNAKLVLPKEITKNKREHTLPIGPATSSLLSSLSPHCSLFFPARGSEHKSFNGWSKSKAALDAASGLTDWTLHDLRRSFATIHARIGTPIHVTERLLNHISGTQAGIVGVYQRHTYMPEMRKAMEAYERELFRIVSAPAVEKAAWAA